MTFSKERSSTELREFHNIFGGDGFNFSTRSTPGPVTSLNHIRFIAILSQ
jgi:hypothetical protein